jgi:hypothetical protein
LSGRRASTIGPNRGEAAQGPQDGDPALNDVEASRDRPEFHGVVFGLGAQQRQVFNGLLKVRQQLADDGGGVALELGVVPGEVGIDDAAPLPLADAVALGAAQGQVREHPACTTFRQSMVLVARYLDTLGVGPVTRARLQIADHQRPEVHKALEAWLGRAPRRSLIPTPDDDF